MIKVCFPLITKFFVAQTLHDQVSLRTKVPIQVNGRPMEANQSIAADQLIVQLPHVELKLLPAARPTYGQEHAKCLVEKEFTLNCRSRPKWDFLHDWANEEPVHFSYYDATQVLSARFHRNLADPEQLHFLLVVSRMLEELNLSSPQSQAMKRELANLRQTNVSSIVNPFSGIIEPGYELAWLEFWAFCIDHYFPECIPFINASLGEAARSHNWFCCLHLHSREPIEGPLAEFLVAEPPTFTAQSPSRNPW